MSVLPKVENQTLHARVYQELRNAIIRGHFAPGEVVTIRRLAAELGTSVMPVREAIHRLISERAIEMQGSRSMRIALLNREKIEDLIKVRSIIEPEAVYLAAERIGEDDILELEVRNRKTRQGDPARQRGRQAAREPGVSLRRLPDRGLPDVVAGHRLALAAERSVPVDWLDAFAAVASGQVDWYPRAMAAGAGKADARRFSRPLCPFPERARYTGSGDPDDAASFTCVAD